MSKIPVEVESEATEGGFEVPRVLHWTDGEKYQVSKVLHVTVSPSGDYDGIRYTVLFGNFEKYIYRDQNGWYVMS